MNTNIVKQFIKKINEADLAGLCNLMTEDHIFVDGLGNSVTGRENMKNGWRQYFTMIPDYWIKIDNIISDESIVLISGKACGTYSINKTLKKENYWKVPASWKAVVKNDKISEWHVFADNEPLRQIITKVQSK